MVSLTEYVVSVVMLFLFGSSARMDVISMVEGPKSPSSVPLSAVEGAHAGGTFLSSPEERLRRVNSLMGGGPASRASMIVMTRVERESHVPVCVCVFVCVCVCAVIVMTRVERESHVPASVYACMHACMYVCMYVNYSPRSLISHMPICIHTYMYYAYM